MRKEFNDTGLCVPNRHYMVDISPKLERIMQLVEGGGYFTINRPRQFGKTTTMWRLTDYLNQQEEYLAFACSFEGVGDAPFAGEQAFCPFFVRNLGQTLRVTNPDVADFFRQASQQIHGFDDLSEWISQYVADTRKQIVVLIDEVDQSSSNQIFLHFLAMLRQKYLLRNAGQDYAFQSVILGGVHDVKTLRLKIRSDTEEKLNSPWNIAIDFTVDLSFCPDEIGTMLHDYAQDKQVEIDVPAVADKLYYYTSGYPYLVSKLCKFIDEAIVPAREDKNWSVEDVDAAFKLIVKDSYTTTLFDSMIKNLENDSDLYDLVFQIVLSSKTINFTIADPLIYRGHLYGILAESEGQCVIHNRIYEQRIYAYMLSKHSRTQEYGLYPVTGTEFIRENRLNVPMVLQRFQAFIKEHYSHRDQKFLEREGRLLFLAYLKPIINGKGFEFKEPNVANERRMDVVVTFLNQRYVIELKRWDGPQAHQKGLQQLSAYLDMYSLKEGCLLIYDFNKKKEYKQEQITFQDKQIFAVWV